MNTRNAMLREWSNLSEIFKEEEQIKTIFSTDKLREQLLPSVVKGIIKTGDFKANIYAGLFGGGVVLLIDGIKEKLLADIEHRKALVFQRIKYLTERTTIIPLR